MTLRQSKVDDSFCVSLESLAESDPLQKWNIDEKGRIAPQMHSSNVTLASTGKNSKTLRRHDVGIRVAADAAADVKTRQDQTFTFQIFLSANEVCGCRVNDK